MDSFINVLFYGDSNTFGVVPRWEDSELPSRRYDENTRWTKLAGGELGQGYRVIEEGLGGRTTIYDRPGAVYKNGLRYLEPCLLSHRPLDLVVVMLGTNDLHSGIQPEYEHLGDGVTALIELIQRTPNCGRDARAPGILVLSPAHIRNAPNGRAGVYAKFHGDTGRALSCAFAEVYGRVAQQKGCWFMDAAAYAHGSEADGVHFTPEGHRALGMAVAQKIKSIFEEYPV